MSLSVTSASHALLADKSWCRQGIAVDLVGATSRADRTRGTFLHVPRTGTASDNPSQEVSGRAPRHHGVGNAWASDQAEQALGGVCCFRFFSLLGGTGQGGHVTGTGRANASRRSGVICQGRNALRSVGL
jgi:hypothetical protein